MTNWTHNFFFVCVCSKSLHVSGTHVLIIRRINCINTTSGICHSVQVTVWYAGLGFTQTCIPDGHLHRVTYTRCRIDTINSPDDEHMSARNMQRFGINTYEKRIVPQVGHLQRLYRDARLTKHKHLRQRSSYLEALITTCF